jgi:hypothetical protein
MARDPRAKATHRAVEQRLRGGAELAGRQQREKVGAGLVERRSQRSFFSGE